jgi:WhiB family transcriptional regulator, redox-sensing transcriptional regulator
VNLPIHTRPDWHADANCRGLDPEVFFPGQGQDTQEQKKICRACDVQVECLTFALNNGEKHGIWGGKSERERRAIRRKHTKAT